MRDQLTPEDRDALTAVKWYIRIVGGGGLVILALVALNEMFGWVLGAIAD